MHEIDGYERLGVSVKNRAASGFNQIPGQRTELDENVDAIFYKHVSSILHEIDGYERLGVSVKNRAASGFNQIPGQRTELDENVDAIFYKHVSRRS